MKRKEERSRKMRKGSETNIKSRGRHENRNESTSDKTKE